MSSEAYQRAQAREQKIWPAFLYSSACNAVQTGERVVVYGLYSGGYLNMHNYLSDIEATDLENILTDYNNKVAELDSRNTVLLNSIVAKQYLASLDVIMNDQKLATREIKRQAEEAEWDAKTAALNTDQAALATLGTKLNAEEQKTAARIAELQAQITAEDTNLSLTEIEAAEKEIAIAEMDLKALRAAIEIQKIQAAIVEEAVKRIEAELKKQRLIVDIAQTRNQIARTTIMDAELEVAEANITAATAELEAIEAELEAILGREAIIDAEIAHQADLIGHVQRMGGLKDALLSIETSGKLRKLADQVTKNEISNDSKLSLSMLELERSYSDQRISESATDAQQTVSAAHILAATKIMAAKIAAATTRVETSVITDLTHAISTGS